MPSGWGGLPVVKCLCRSVSVKGVLLPQCFLKVPQCRLQSRESPEAISSSKRKDVSRVLLFPGAVAAEEARMSILVPVVMHANDDAWFPALITPKVLPGRCERPPITPSSLGSDRALRGNHVKGAL